MGSLCSICMSNTHHTLPQLINILKKRLCTMYVLSNVLVIHSQTGYGSQRTLLALLASIRAICLLTPFLVLLWAFYSFGSYILLKNYVYYVLFQLSRHTALSSVKLYLTSVAILASILYFQSLFVPFHDFFEPFEVLEHRNDVRSTCSVLSYSIKLDLITK